MTVPLGVTPNELRATARYLAQVSGDMKAVQSGLMQTLRSEGEAWGDDKIGKQFADGAKGYVAQRDWVDGSITAKTDLLDFYANGLQVTADALEQQDSP
ncbi:WXG100 family type VII secretion target [Mycolicibacterium sp. XJ870]